MENALFTPLLLQEETTPTFRFCVYQSSRHHLLAWYTVSSFFLWFLACGFGIYEAIHPMWLLGWIQWSIFAVVLIFVSYLPLFFVLIQHRYILSIILLPNHKISVQTWSIWTYKKHVWNRKDCSIDYSNSEKYFFNGIPSQWLPLRFLSKKLYWIDSEGNFPYGENLLKEVFALGNEDVSSKDGRFYF
jgi:hypothetical protein